MVPVSESSPSSHKYRLTDPALRARVESALRAQGPAEERPEQSCSYRLDFVRGGERVVVKQYTNGTLYMQAAGNPGALLRELAGAVEGAARGQTIAPPAKPAAGSRAPRGSSVGIDVQRPFDGPWIGSDEAGKGDYFGPLVACAVYVDDRIVALLETLGVRDSKLLTDALAYRLAGEIRAVCGDQLAEVVVPPERYNALYETFRREGKNLNTLLAWGHARAIETVLERVPCQNVIVDQFADARYIRSRLEGRDRTRHLNVVQVPRAEENIAVAAASILARERFLRWLESAARAHRHALPKGASPAVEAAARAIVARDGPEVLPRIAKLHFKTTQRVLGHAQPALALGGSAAEA